MVGSSYRGMYGLTVMGAFPVGIVFLSGLAYNIQEVTAFYSTKPLTLCLFWPKNHSSFNIMPASFLNESLFRFPGFKLSILKLLYFAVLICYSNKVSCSCSCCFPLSSSVINNFCPIECCSKVNWPWDYVYFSILGWHCIFKRSCPNFIVYLLWKWTIE